MIGALVALQTILLQYSFSTGNAFYCNDVVFCVHLSLQWPLYA